VDGKFVQKRIAAGEGKFSQGRWRVDPVVFRYGESLQPVQGGDRQEDDDGLVPGLRRGIG
jgi:hypothetical protein